MPWHLARLLQGLAALQLAKQHGVEMAFGSDLLGDLHGAQLREFELRSRVLPPKVGRSRGGGAVFLGSRFTPNTSTQSRLGAGAAGGLQQGGGGGGLRRWAHAPGWQRQRRVGSELWPVAPALLAGPTAELTCSCAHPPPPALTYLSLPPTPCTLHTLAGPDPLCHSHCC